MRQGFDVCFREESEKDLNSAFLVKGSNSKNRIGE